MRHRSDLDIYRSAVYSVYRAFGNPVPRTSRWFCGRGCCSYHVHRDIDMSNDRDGTWDTLPNALARTLLIVMSCP